jgi:transposase
MKDCPAFSATNTVAIVEDVFSRDQEHKQQLEERLHQGPGEEARQQAAATDQGPPPSRWTLDTIRASVDWLADYSRSGVWRLLNRLDLRLRSGRVQQFSPDPAYAEKLIDLEMALWEA